MNVELWKLIASIGGILIAAVTTPIIWAIRAESGKIRAESKRDLAETELRLTKELTRIKTDMTEMESRLNTRIDTRLTHR
jgi:hypothetical protein